jgi:hypothetical protein
MVDRILGRQPPLEKVRRYLDSKWCLSYRWYIQNVGIGEPSRTKEKEFAMNLSPRDAKNLRRWSVVAVAANIGVAIVAAVVLPAQAIGLLPVLALTLPLLTTGVLDAALQTRTQH